MAAGMRRCTDRLVTRRGARGKRRQACGISPQAALLEPQRRRELKLSWRKTRTSAERRRAPACAARLLGASRRGQGTRPLTERRFSPPWSAEETDACFIVKDHNGKSLSISRRSPAGERGQAAEQLFGRTSGGTETKPRRKKAAVRRERSYTAATISSLDRRLRSHRRLFALDAGGSDPGQ